MDEKVLLERIKYLEEKLLEYQQKEKYISTGIIKTKDVYEAARHNAEKIIARAVLIAYEIKERTSNFVDELKDDPSHTKLGQLLQKYQDIFEMSKADIMEISAKLVDKVKK